ncbi:MAG: Gfo/Idh/MocA family oxidoreductase [Gemmatimonadota bacterium]
MTPIPAGVIGVGQLGAEHARLLRDSPDFTLVGVYDVDTDRAEEIARINSARSFPDSGSLAGECDAVVVAVPTSAHGDVATVALEHDCHTLVEKPLTRTIEDATRLIHLAAQRGRVLGVGHVERFNGVLLACEPYLDSPRFIESRRLAPYQVRGTDVTVILDLMIHDIDLVLGLVDRPLLDVHAIGASVLTGSIDMANARLVFDGGAVADISASRVSRKPLRQLRLYQDTGYFSLDLATGRGRHLRRTNRPLEEVGGIDDLLESIPLESSDGEPLARELDAFARAIRGEPSRLVSGAKGREALGVAIRITREIEESTNVST